MLNLTFRLILRNLLSGAVAIGVCYLSLYGLSSKEIEDVPGLEILSALALVVGSIIYAVHRSLIYWKLIYPRLVKKVWGDEKTPEVLDMNRWEERAKEISVLTNISDWTDQVHFLYVISWGGLVGLVIALISAAVYGMCVNGVGFCIAVSILILTFVAAIIDNIRYLEREKLILNKEFGRQ